VGTEDRAGLDAPAEIAAQGNRRSDEAGQRFYRTDFREEVL
jgi:hypothetical protein